MSTTIAKTPRVLEDVSQVLDLFGSARGASCVALHGGRLYDLTGNSSEAGVDPLKNSLRQIQLQPQYSPGASSREILGSEDLHNLGHAPAWIDAGAAYEELMERLETGAAVDFVFCLDPWSGQLLSRANELAPQARWVLIWTQEQHSGDTHSPYWDQLKDWYSSLPLSAVISQRAWEAALLSEGQETGATSGFSRDQRLHLSRPGAWAWKRISGASSEEAPLPTPSVVFIAKYSGSVPHMKVFLESITRQDYPKTSIHIVIVLSQGANDLRYYLRWFALAQPQLRVTIIDPAAGAEGSAALVAALGESDSSVMVGVDDYAILPAGFCKSLGAVSSGSETLAVRYAPISLEASAHILTGNLDAIAEHDKLIQAFGGKATDQSGVVGRPATVVPPGTGREVQSRFVANLLGEAQAVPETAESRPALDQPLLKLVDLE